MSSKQQSILIVDDDDVLRNTLVCLFVGYGFEVLEASDGLSALAEMKSGLPDVLISDLNMPAMCGFELLSIVRRRFPSIGVVAMSGAYSGNAVPAGVAADAFYPKGSGTSINALFGMVDALTERDKSPRRRSAVSIWLHRFVIDCHPEDAFLVWYPECLRMFSQRVATCVSEVSRVRCPHCSTDIQIAVLAFRNERRDPKPAPAQASTV